MLQVYLGISRRHKEGLTWSPSPASKRWRATTFAWPPLGCFAGVFQVCFLFCIFALRKNPFLCPMNSLLPVARASLHGITLWVALSHTRSLVFWETLDCLLTGSWSVAQQFGEYSMMHLFWYFSGLLGRLDFLRGWCLAHAPLAQAISSSFIPLGFPASWTAGKLHWLDLP